MLPVSGCMRIDKQLLQGKGWLRRLILFLQQSSVEWASSLWMHVVQELDPEVKRTVGNQCAMYPAQLTCSLARAPSPYLVQSSTPLLGSYLVESRHQPTHRNNV